MKKHKRLLAGLLAVSMVLGTGSCSGSRGTDGSNPAAETTTAVSTNAATTDIRILTPQLIIKIGVFYIILRIIDVAAFYYMANRGHVMGAKIETDMRRDLFDKLQQQTFSFFANNKVGQLMSRITNDLFDVTEFAHHCPEELFITSIKIVVSFIVLCTFNVPLTLLIFLIMPIM